MSTVLTKETKQSTDEGLKGFADDIESLLAFSARPQRYQDIRDHFEEDENYFEEDLEYISDALEYLQEEDRVKQDIRLDGEFPESAYSIRDYDSI